MNSGFDQYPQRRRSFSGAPPSVSFAPPHSDGGFRGRDGFNDFNNGFPEVSGPPPFPPPGAAPGFSNSSMPFPNAPPPPLHSQSFPSGGGPGGYSSSMGGMPSSYPLGTREPHSFPPHDSFGMNSNGLPPPPAAYSNSYDSSPLSDNQYALDDNFGGTRGRTLSSGGGGFGPPALLPPAPPMTPYPSGYSGKRGRRASSVGPGMGGMGGMGFAGYVGDPSFQHHRPGGHVTIKFRLKGSTHSGISVAEALERVRISQGNGYLMHDILPDVYSKHISLRVRWSGYRSNTYNIPLSGDFQGYVDLQSLARRTARSIVHFMQANGIRLSWDRVVISRLEEISPGIWIPLLTTH